MAVKLCTEIECKIVDTDQSIKWAKTEGNVESVVFKHFGRDCNESA